MHGYTGRVLDIDLTNHKVDEISTCHEELKEYLGGVGFTSKIIYEQIPKGADPLGSSNILCFATGPFVGTNAPTACRTEVSAKSPATGLFGTSNSGNFWGSELKFAGYDGIIIRGQSDFPVYINIKDNDIKILPALNLWGRDSWETIKFIREEHQDTDIQIAVIGQAGENLCRFASIENGPYDAWGRTGLGAVMGSKKLKAISVRGSNGITVYDKKRYLSVVKEIRDALDRSPFYGPFAKFGTMLATVPYYEFGALPGRNFQTGVVEDWMDTRSRKIIDQFSARCISCITCPIACAHWVEIKEGPYKGLKIKDLEVTPLIGFGAGCDINNIPAIVKLTEACQRYGMDLISAASTVAFAMELFQRKIITESQIGIKLEWGNENASLKLLDMIANRQGIGDILAEGTKRASEKIPDSEYYAMHIKGLEIPMADARGRWSTWTFGNITNIRGGDHLRNRNPVENLRFNENPIEYKTEKFAFSDDVYEKLDMFDEVKEAVFDSKSKDVNIAKMSKWSEDLISVYNAIGLCIRPPILQSIGPSFISALYTSLTGIEISPKEIMKTGERIWNIQKLFNLREGEKIEDSRYPQRFYQESMPKGPSIGRILDKTKVQATLEEYYKARGWKKGSGKPTKKKLNELNI